MRISLLLLLLNLLPNNRIHSELKHFLDTIHLLTTAFDIYSSHPLRDRGPLLRRDGGKSLRLEEIDAIAFVPQIRFESDENEGRGGAEMEHFRVPLVHDVFERIGTIDGEADE